MSIPLQKANIYARLGLLLLALCLAQCANKQPARLDEEEANTTVTPISLIKGATTELVFENTVDAARTIVVDTATRYFDDLTPIDIALQIHRDDLPQDSTTLRNTYRDVLRASIRAFTTRERLLLTTLFTRITAELIRINPRLCLPVVRLVKTDGSGFGATAFYTRQNSIIISAPLLQAATADSTQQEGLTRVLSHELFHIISRANPALRRQLYRRIGFEEITTNSEIPRLPAVLAQKRVLNPDGMLPVRIHLADTLDATFISHATTDHPDRDIPFFDAVTVEVYQLKAADAHKNSTWYVVADSVGGSTLANTWEKPFYQRAGTNTDYIQHPDEILADNFKLLLQRERGIPFLQPLDYEGSKLLDDLRSILKAYHPRR